MRRHVPIAPLLGNLASISYTSSTCSSTRTIKAGWSTPTSSPSRRSTQKFYTPAWKLPKTHLMNPLPYSCSFTSYRKQAKNQINPPLTRTVLPCSANLNSQLPLPINSSVSTYYNLFVPTYPQYHLPTRQRRFSSSQKSKSLKCRISYTYRWWTYFDVTNVE